MMIAVTVQGTTISATLPNTTTAKYTANTQGKLPLNCFGLPALSADPLLDTHTKAL
jgi:hypothetical protein